MTKDQITAILKDKGIKVTENRLKVIDCLNDDKHFHTVQEIMEHVDGLNTKSVYNNLKVLMDKDIVDAYSFSGTSKFALNHHYAGEHNIAHVVDGDSASHLELEPKIMKSIKKAAKEQGYDDVSVKIFVKNKK